MPRHLHTPVALRNRCWPCPHFTGFLSLPLLFYLPFLGGDQGQPLCCPAGPWHSKQAWNLAEAVPWTGLQPPPLWVPGDRVAKDSNLESQAV